MNCRIYTPALVALLSLSCTTRSSRRSYIPPQPDPMPQKITVDRVAAADDANDLVSQMNEMISELEGMIKTSRQRGITRTFERGVPELRDDWKSQGAKILETWDDLDNVLDYFLKRDALRQYALEHKIKLGSNFLLADGYRQASDYIGRIIDNAIEDEFANTTYPEIKNWHERHRVESGWRNQVVKIYEMAVDRCYTGTHGQVQIKGKWYTVDGDIAFSSLAGRIQSDSNRRYFRVDGKRVDITGHIGLQDAVNKRISHCKRYGKGKQLYWR